MRIERTLNYVTALGPGRRLAVWVNGCSRGCAGCVSERLQKIDERTEADIEEYFFGYRTDGIDGVTVSGGEPFEQTEELLHLLRYFRRRGVRDILVYTGFLLEELQARGDGATDAALAEISVLIDGPYVASLDTGKGNLKGSDNQRIHFFDPSLAPAYHAYFREQREMQEVTLPGSLLAVGIPDTAYIEAFRKKKT